MMVIMKATAMPLPIPWHLCTLKEPNDYKSYWKSWDLNNLPMLPDKFETKVVENSGIQKQFKIIKVYLTKPS
jgi:DNA topoisomerase-3